MRDLRWQNITPLNRGVLVCLEQEEESLLVRLHQPKNHFRVLRSADDCEFAEFLQPNDFAFVKKLNPSRASKYLVNRKEQVYLIPEQDIVAVFTDELKPLGKNVLVKRRLTSELYLDSKIIIPRFTQAKDQTLEAELVTTGLMTNGRPFPYELNKGDLVVLKNWSMNQVEIRLHDGQYGLIVPINELSHLEHERASITEFT